MPLSSSPFSNMWRYIQATYLPNHNSLFITSSMEPSIKNQPMKNYKQAKFAYNLALYSLTSVITFFFFSSPFWFPSITSHFLISSIQNIVSFCSNAKCLFILGNLIVIILVGETKLKHSTSSATSDIYDEYVARSRSSHHKKENIHGPVKTLNVEEKINHYEEKKEIKFNSMPRGEEKKKGMGMRSCKSEVWGENGILVKMEKPKGKKEEQFLEGGKIKMGMRSSKSAVWSKNEVSRMEKGKKEEQSSKANIMNDEEKKIGTSSSKSAVWSESVRLKMEEQSSKNLSCDEEKKMVMESSRSAVWSESDQIAEREKGEGVKKERHEEKMKMGMRSCRSEIWSESEIARLGKTHVIKKEEQQLSVLNKRVEDFIARVNKQRLLEAKIVDHIY